MDDEQELEDDEFEDQELDEDDDEDGDEDEEAPPEQRAKSAPPSLPTGSLWDFLAEQPKTRLLNLLKDAAKLSSAVYDMLESRYHTETGQVGELVAAARDEIETLGEDIDEEDRYRGTPDVDPLKARFQALVQAGCIPELLGLAEELLDLSDSLVESFDHDGEFVMDLDDCLTIVYQALGQSKLPPAEQLQWLFTLEASDPYDITTGGETAFWKTERPREGWNGMVSALLEILNASDEDAVAGDRRCSLTNHAIEAMGAAGREQEIIPLCEREAERAGDYSRLVVRLIDAQRWTDAEKWCRKGIEAGSEQIVWNSPTLRDHLRTIYGKMGEKELVAAIRAEQFFEKPGADSFEAVCGDAESAGVRPAVEAWARHYLETGRRPQPAAGEKAATGAIGAGKSSADLPPWPLRDPQLPPPKEPVQVKAPMVRDLLEIAIREKKPDEVLKWYDHPRQSQINYFRSPDAEVAAAVGDKHPERAIAIWKRLTESALTQTGDRAYQAAADALRPLRDLLIRKDREPEWREYFSSIRLQHRRKRNLMAILDRLENKGPIVNARERK